MHQVNFRVADTRREIRVRYQTLPEIIAEVSGSWAISLLLGVSLAVALKRVDERQPQVVP